MAHLAPQLTALHAQLQAQLKTSEARNADLAATVTAQRNEIEGIVSGLEATIRDIEGANRVMEQAIGSTAEGGADLRNEVKEIHAELHADVDMT